MKFFLVTGYSKILPSKDEASQGFYDEPSYDFYKYFLDLSTKTAERFLDEDFERVILSGTYPFIVDAHRDNIKKLYKLWKDNYPCNILYIGPDVFFLKKVKFSDKFTKFMMFNHCPAPMNKRPEFGFDHFMNSDIRYFPSTMDESLWHLALQMEKEWPSYDTLLGSWEFEGIVWNKMLWQQEESIDYFLKPEYDYEYRLREFKLSLKDNKNISIQDAFLAHLHGSGLMNLYPKIMELYKQGVFPEDLWLAFFATIAPHL